LFELRHLWHFIFNYEFYKFLVIFIIINNSYSKLIQSSGYSSILYPALMFMERAGIYKHWYCVYDK